jgi:hypothetical protein
MAGEDRFVGEVTGVNERGPTGAVVESVEVRHPERDETVTADVAERYDQGDEVAVEYSEAIGGYRVFGEWEALLDDLDIVVQRMDVPHSAARRAFRQAGGDPAAACQLLETSGVSDEDETG